MNARFVLRVMTAEAAGPPGRGSTAERNATVPRHDSGIPLKTPNVDAHQAPEETCRHNIPMVGRIGGPSAHCEECDAQLAANPRYYADRLHLPNTQENQP